MEPASKRLVTKDEKYALYRERVQETFQLDPVVDLVFGKKHYSLEYDNRAVKGILKDCGLNVLKEGLNDDAMEDPDVLGSLLHRGLQRNHGDLTVEQVDALFTSRHYPYIINRIRAAMEMFLPDLSDVETAEERKAREQAEAPELAEDPQKQPTTIG